jgi:sugar lactone lactonase YvrE
MLLLITINLLLTAHVFAETYTFKTMWPQLENQWFFDTPKGMCMDDNHFIYIADQGNHQIKKFSADGRFVLSFGSEGSDMTNLSRPSGIAHYNGSIYVVDTDNHRIQQYSTNGDFIAQWGKYGSCEKCFDSPQEIAIDSRGNIFVSDTGNYRIHQFSSQGKWIQQWGQQGNGPTKFSYPLGIAVDQNDNVFVCDPDLIQVQQFEIQPVADSYTVAWKQTIENWGSYSRPKMIAFDDQNNMYIATSGNFIEKYDNNRQFQFFWGDTGNQISEFKMPWDIVQGLDHTLFVADALNNRIQLFTDSGDFITQWSSTGSKQGMFHSPMGIAVDANNDIYVVDQYNHQIQKFTSDGQFLLQWGSNGNDTGKFRYPDDITIDHDQNIYVTDPGNYRVQKFSSTGDFLTEFGEWGIYDGQFETIEMIKCRPSGQIWVFDNRLTWKKKSNSRLEIQYVNRLQAFDNDGKLSGVWENQNKDKLDCFDFLSDQNLLILQGNRFKNYTITQQYKTILLETKQEWDAGDIQNPTDMAIDSKNNIFVTDPENHCIHYYADNGESITIGHKGTLPGQFNIPEHICLDSSNQLYVTDQNHRVQVFQKNRQEEQKKAIIIAGGWPFFNSEMNNTTCMAAGGCYKTLINRGYDSTDVQYLHNETATLTSVENALSDVASYTSELLVYMVGQGSSSKYALNEWEQVSCEKMDVLLKALSSKRIIIIADFQGACEYLNALTRDNLVKISNTAEHNDLPLFYQTNLWFSQFFWNALFHGDSFENAFTFTKNCLKSLGYMIIPTVDIDNDIVNETNDISALNTIQLGQTNSISERSDIISLTTTLDTNGILAAQIMVSNYTQTSHVKLQLIHLSSQKSIDIPTYQIEDNTYAGMLSNVYISGGYTLTAFAITNAGRYSFPKSIEIEQLSGPDYYENDYDKDTAKWISLDKIQHHTFHAVGDMDWVKFDARQNECYTIATNNLENRCDTIFDIFDRDAKTQLHEINLSGIGINESFTWLCPLSGTYYLRIRHQNPNVYGASTGYDLNVSVVQQKQKRHITGILCDAITNAPIPFQTISLGNCITAVSNINGQFYFFNHPIGKYTLTVSNSSYQPYTQNVAVLPDTLSDTSLSTEMIHTGIIQLMPVIHQITVSSRGGHVYPSGIVPIRHGATQVFHITAENCFQLSSVYLDDAPLIYTMTENTIQFSESYTNHTLKFVFSPIYYSIDASANSVGKIMPSGKFSVQCGENQTFTLMPDVNYYLDALTINCLSNGSYEIKSDINEYTIENIQSNYKINAAYLTLYHEISLNAGWNLISVPFSLSYPKYFPDANVVYQFENGGYQPTDEMLPGHGYWIKNDIQGKYQLKGKSSQSENLQFSAGWHLIGSMFKKAPKITSDCEISAIFVYQNGNYQQLDVLKQGQGVWVKLTADGCVVSTN